MNVFVYLNFNYVCIPKVTSVKVPTNTWIDRLAVLEIDRPTDR